MSGITPAVLARLQEFDTPTICNIIELFEVRPRNQGFMDRSIRAAFPEMQPMVGFASTISCRTSYDHRQESADYAGLDDQIRAFDELDGPAVVVFQDLDDPPLAATFGEVMCTSYQKFGAVGLITSGPGRDLDQVREIGFPVFTDGANCSHGYITMSAVHAPVQVGGLAVYANDLLHGDLNGVTSIPKEIAVEAAEIGQEFVDCERVVLDALAQDDLTLEQYAEARQEMGRMQSALQQRVTRRAG
ncbi:MAG: RraA family protein [Anaerolineaceae bacterium]|nr:RraA family protein [Anaerolineaceae bacterium]